MVAHDKALVGSSSLGFFRCLGEKIERREDEGRKRGCEDVEKEKRFVLLGV